MTVVKALIAILDKEAVDPSRGLLPVIPVMFNPNKVSATKTAQYAEVPIPGLDVPILQFVRGQSETVVVELMFDTTLSGLGSAAAPVDQLTRPFYELVKVQPRTHAPPRIRFIWGVGLSFTAVVQQLRRDFTMFTPAGIPVRATLNVTFRQHQAISDGLPALNLQSADRRRTVVARQDEPLSRIAAAEYGDATLWRAIADENPDLDPLDPQVGRQIRVPPVPDGGR